jgi:hypothetical protein
LANPPDAATVAAADDMAAEPDDTVPGDAAQGQQYAAYEPDYRGLCEGGPYTGRTVPSRCPGGFLLYDKAGARMWTYRADPAHPGAFLADNNGRPTPVTDIGAVRQAADGTVLDVIAYDDGPAVT